MSIRGTVELLQRAKELREGVAQHLRFAEENHDRAGQLGRIAWQDPQVSSRAGSSGMLWSTTTTLGTKLEEAARINERLVAYISRLIEQLVS